MTKVIVKPCIPDEYSFLLSSYFTMACGYMPENMYIVTKHDKIPIHEMNTPYSPYSSLVRSLVNIGVVMMVIDLCMMVHTRNQKPALAWTGRPRYLFINPINLFFIREKIVSFRLTHKKLFSASFLTMRRK